MPELPEVETVRRGLAPVLEGRRILQADVRRPDLRWPFPPRMAERLAGARVERLGRRSKYLLADLDSRETLIVHLGMSGRWLVSGVRVGVFHHALAAPEKHDHVILDIEGGGRLTFNDARRFGAMDLWPTEDLEAHRLLASLGPEPLGNAFDGRYLAERLAGRKTPVKAVLLDQRVVAGLGNIYVCEALWRAGISPLAPANGRKGVTVAAIYTMDNIKISTGINYTKLGGPDLGVGQSGNKTKVAEMDDGELWGVGVRIGYSF